MFEDQYRFYSTEDIAAMKINGIINRGAKKDFFDLAELLNHFDKKSLFNLYQKKYSAASDMMFIKSMIFFDDAEHDPDPLDAKLSWVNVKELIHSTFM